MQKYVVRQTDSETLIGFDSLEEVESYQSEKFFQDSFDTEEDYDDEKSFIEQAFMDGWNSGSIDTYSVEKILLRINGSNLGSDEKKELKRLFEKEEIHFDLSDYPELYEILEDVGEI